MDVLLTELGEVEKWPELGEHLPGVTTADITSINFTHKLNRDIRACKKELFTVWLKSSPEEPTWSTVVGALRKIREAALARKLARKYGKGICIPCTFIQGTLSVMQLILAIEICSVHL